MMRRAVVQIYPLTRVGALSLLLVSLSAVAAPRNLAERHKEFLSGPTNYLITKAEKDAFQALPTDADRDRFIEQFWETRNPKRGTESNEFKDEFYRRLAFVNQFYGNDAGSDGWRTDRGKTYLLFGKPQTLTSFVHNSELMPAELWFYANPGVRELPSFFYVLFFDRSGSGEFRFYHPYIHGPDKLIRSEPDKAQAYRYLRSVNAELAQASLSLVPGEPVDTETFNGSMSSASIMHAIQGFKELKSYERLISSRWTELERVKSKIEYKLSRASLATFTAFEEGEPWLHWHLEMNDSSAQTLPSGPLKYEIAAKLFAGDKLVYERTDAPEINVPEDAKAKLAKTPIAYESRMPLVPGQYRLEVTAKWSTGQVFEIAKEVAVPKPSDRSAVSEIVITGRPEADQRRRAFQFGGFRFTPAAEPFAFASRGVSILYQLSIPEPRPSELEVEYVVADSALKAKKTLAEKLNVGLADAHGTLTVAKTLPLEEFSPGTYQLAVRIKDPQTGKISANHARFTVVSDIDSPQPIVIAPVMPDTQQRVAANHYERALAWLAQGDSDHARKSLQASWEISRNPAIRSLLLQLNERSTRSDVRKNTEDKQVQAKE